MVDKEEILEDIKVIKKNIEIIESLNIKNLENIKSDIKNYYTLSMALFTIFNNLIDIGDTLISDMDLGYVGRYFDIPNILYDKNIISSNSKKFFVDFIRSRNDIDSRSTVEMKEEEIYWCFKNIDKIDILLEEFKKQLDRDK